MTISAIFAHEESRKFIASIPSFRKGGLGRIWNRDRKSPSVPLFQRGIEEQSPSQFELQSFHRFHTFRNRESKILRLEHLERLEPPEQSD